MRKKLYLLIVLGICVMVIISACTNKEEKIALLKSDINSLVQAKKYEEAINKYEEILKIDESEMYKQELSKIIKQNEEMKKELAKQAEEEKRIKEEKIKAAEIPVPYKKAIENFSLGKMDLALKYLDMTITDFAKTEYKLKAHVMKSHILSVQYLAQISTFNTYANEFKNFTIAV